MSPGQRIDFSDRINGFTLIELLISTLLLSVIFMAVSALHVANHRFFLTAKDRVDIGAELQYSIQHIYEHVMVGTGEITIVNSSEFYLTYIDKFDITEKTCRYQVTGAGEFLFDREDDGTFDESLGQKVTFLASGCEFSMDGNILNIKLTARYPVPRSAGSGQVVQEQLTLYSASAPRCKPFPRSS